MHQVTDPPNITDWLQGWRTVAGAAVSALAAAAALGLLWHEIRARRSESRDREAAQARLITVRAMPARIVKNLIREIVVTIKIHSTAPVFEIEFGATRAGEEDACGVLRDELAAGEEATLRWKLANVLPHDGETYPAAYFDTYATFTDATGLRWNRHGREQPQRLITDPPIPWWRKSRTMRKFGRKR